MFGFHDSAGRETSAQNPGRVGYALQPRAPPFQPRTGGFLNLLKCSYRCKVTTDIPSPKTAESRLARFSAASITNTGGKGSLREGRIAQMTAAPARRYTEQFPFT